MIQEYINQQLFKIKDDANLDKLRKAAADVAGKLKKDKPKISAYTIVALDPDIPAANSLISEIQKTIIEQWSTFLANHKDKPVAIIRAVILEALNSISGDIQAAGLIWFSGRNAIKHYKLGKEKDLLFKFMLEIGERVESSVSQSWSFPPGKEIDVPEAPSASLNADELTPLLTASPINVKEAVDNINKVLKKQVNEIRVNQREFIQRMSVMQIRTQLLWWRETGYSPMRKVRYGSLRPGLLQIILAIDYSALLPTLHPESATYFLKETYDRLSNTSDEKIRIVDFLKHVESSRTELLEVIPKEYSWSERTLLINFIYALAHGKTEMAHFKSIIGVASTVELAASDLVAWLFHDLNAIKSSTAK